ncbi:ARM repeat-containing protein [Coniophora puteana RWD-64-598 SS2]|uniref:ARM repeat-containing protein n=1 Tax=Coniophora puteana (strain RWD-64-598) TaxID=741705 RepID=A0A5M3MUM0_CONPW|nr:ARM repeat-containing protein [Coniophora puteana RWD-64-598 SS2]EIW82813.1 ARM repeat-containing protein [Coniophora puteana RWD-64-598 SS2]
MDAAASKADEEKSRHARRTKVKQQNANRDTPDSAKLDSSLKRHTALIKRMRQTVGSDNRDQIVKDIDTLSLEKYVDEIAGATLEGIARCKTEKDVWSAVEIICALHRRFPAAYTGALIPLLGGVLAPPNKAALSALPQDQREKEDSVRLSRQRPVLRVCAELALVGIIRDGPGRSGGEWIMKAVKDLLSNDPTLSSLPLLSTFLKNYSRPYLGIVPPQPKQSQTDAESGQAASSAQSEVQSHFPPIVHEGEELVEQEIRDRFKRMCEGYFDNVAKKLVIEHKRLQDQDRRNHEAYIRSGEIFEDRQQAYEKMTKSYEKLLSNCQTLSELLYMPMPSLPTASQKTESIQIGTNTGLHSGDDDEGLSVGGKWEDEEERRFFEDIQDLKDFVPKSVLGIEGEKQEDTEGDEAKEKLEKERAEADVKKLQEELQDLKLDGKPPQPNGDTVQENRVNGHDGEKTPDLESPKAGSPPGSPQLAPQGPSQMLTALLARLPDATNRAMIDQAAVEFTFLNSKAARKRLVKFLGSVPKNRTDLLPHYSRLAATLNKYMPDIGTELVAILDEEFRYLQRKKNVVKELAETRIKNIAFLSNLTKFCVVPSHLILHMFKVCLDDFSGTNVENIALLLEGCGRFLLRSEDTRARFETMLELMRRKQSMQHFDQRQILLLENAYYQCNPPERAPREEKQRTPIELFMRHLIFDVLAKKTIDKVLKLIRKLDWDDPAVVRSLHKIFTKPWKIKYINISLLAMLTYDLQRYHPSFAIAVVDQVLEDVRIGLEQNIYGANQRRLATMKYLGELYIYRVVGSALVFDTLWSLVTFGHPDGHPTPHGPCPMDMPDDFFRVRLVCVMLDTVGMCFDRGTQKRKLDNFLVFFQYYVLCKSDTPMDVDFMLSDSLEAIRPNMPTHKNVAEAAVAVDEMFDVAMQNAGLKNSEDSAEESDGEDGDRPIREDEDDEESTEQETSDGERTASPEPVVVRNAPEHLGPSEEADAEFAKELARIMTESSAESRKVDKKAAWWDTAVLAPGMRKKRTDDPDGEGDGDSGTEGPVMNFTVITKRGNKQQLKHLPVPVESSLAVHTRSAQLQDKVEQQHLKRLVLNYEQREEAEEMKALEARNRAGAIKIRYVG